MDQRWIGGTLLTAGIGLFGVVAWVQSDRHALTSARPAVTSQEIHMDISPLKAEETSASEENNAVLELPPVQITGRKPARVAPVPVAAPPVLDPPEAEEPAHGPCSPWEEIGPVHVDDGVPTGVRRVRKLC